MPCSKNGARASSCRSDGIVSAGVDSKELVFIVIEIDESEAQATVAARAISISWPRCASDFSAGSNIGPPTVLKTISALWPFCCFADTSL